MVVVVEGMPVPEKVNREWEKGELNLKWSYLVEHVLLDGDNKFVAV